MGNKVKYCLEVSLTKKKIKYKINNNNKKCVKTDKECAAACVKIASFKCCQLNIFYITLKMHICPLPLCHRDNYNFHR
ncbi:hypothetical protein FKM82_011080 [Ascaphus truei]